MILVYCAKNFAKIQPFSIDSGPQKSSKLVYSYKEKRSVVDEFTTQRLTGQVHLYKHQVSRTF